MSARTVALSSKPKVSVVTMTPSMARKLLNANTRNRNIRPSRVESLVRDIRAGRWQENGETVKVSKSGVLLDGQHRLSAIVKANMAVPLTLVTNLEETSQDTIDTGMRRTFGDQLRIGETKHATIVASLARRLVLWENGYRFNSGNYVASEGEMRDFIERNPDIFDSANIADMGRKQIRVPPSILGMTHFMFHRIDPSLTREFFTKFVDGIGLSYGEPVYALRKRLAEEGRTASKLPATHRVNEADLLALVIHAWNLTRQGKRITRIQAPKGGWTKDNFPTPA